MNREVNILETVEVENKVIPSTNTIQATYNAIKRLVENTIEGGQTIVETLHELDDSLNILNNSTTLNNGWSSLGIFALPIPIAMKTAMSIANRLVKQKTGLSLESWSEFVSTAHNQFEDYLAQLAMVAGLSPKYDAITSDTIELDLVQIEQDVDLLREVRLKTKLLKPVMGKVSQVNQIVDAILESKEQIEQEDRPGEEKPKEATTFAGSFLKGQQRWVDAVKEKAVGGQEKLPDWLMSPIYQIRERTRQLDSQVSLLSKSILSLEDLLDLEIAQIQAVLGKISTQEIDIISVRVAAHVTVPQLKEKLSGAKEQVSIFQAYLEKLNAIRESGKMGDNVYQSLLSEYKDGLSSAQALLKILQKEAEDWKSQVTPQLQIGLIWMQEQLEMVKVREKVGQLSYREFNDRTTGLTKEIDQLKGAIQILATL